MNVLQLETVISTDDHTKHYSNPKAAIQALIEQVSTSEEASALARRVFAMFERSGHKIGFDTIQDIINGSTSTDIIKGVFKVKLKECAEQQNARITAMVKPLESIKVDYSTLTLDTSLALVGKMGEGKNALCMEPWFERSQQSGQHPIFVAPLRSLLAKFVGEQEHYESIEDPHYPRTGLRTTAHSFVNRANADSRFKARVLMLDELIKITEIINSKIWGAGTMSARLDGWKEIISAVKRADRVVLSDAHLGQAYLEIFERLTGKSFPAYEPMTSSYAGIDVGYGYTQATLVSKSMEIVSKGGKVAYFFDGKIDDGKAIEALLVGQGVRAIFLHSTDRSDTAGKVLEASIDTDNLENYDVVICSPAIGPGWSCVLPSFTEVMIECLGTISPASVLQCVKRFRAVKNVSIAFSLNTNRSSAKRNLPETASNVAFYEASEEFIDEAVDHDAAFKLSRQYLADPVGRGICKMKALENWSRNRYESFVVRALETLGFNVRFIQIDECKDTKALKKKHADEIEAQKKAFFANDQLLEGKALQSAIGRKLEKGASQQSQWLIEKSVAAEAMGVTCGFNNDEVEFLIDKSGFEIVKRCDLVVGNGKVNLSNAVRVELFNDLLAFVRGKSVVYTSDLETFVEKLKGEKLRWNASNITKFTLLTKTLFEVKGTSKPSSAVKGILALLGFKLYTSPCRTAGKYLIDSSVHDFAMRYIVMPASFQEKVKSDAA